MHELLGIEAGLLSVVEPEVGKRAHFFAVSTYQLQHPSRSTVDALDWLRAAVARMLRDPVSTDYLRRENARNLQGTKISRTAPPEDRTHVDPRWPRTWTLTAVDVISGGEQAYVEGVARWAAATVRDLHAAVGGSPG